ncbi:MAG: hypothetical protein JWR50_2381 [Mucilaginibacter sp.]|nr:hypothetical protein [Mucilaginibacter sp.]
METINQQKKRSDKTGDNKVARIRKKSVSVLTNESSVAAELKNREHGNEKPTR